MLQPYEQLEVEFASWLNSSNSGLPWHTVACSSGTAALHLGLEALQLPSRVSYVAVPEFTMVACARAVSLARLVPWFVDCLDNLLLDPKLLERAPKHTRAVMAVHIYGRYCDMDAITRFAASRKAYVIEDLAEAHGLQPHPQTDVACWSFYKNKIVHGEEGGMVAFRGSAQAALAKQLRSLGFTDAHDFQHVPNGMNYRLANLLATPILESFRQMEWNLGAREGVAGYYDALIPREWRMPEREVIWVYDLRIPGMTRTEQNLIVKGLNAQGIAARHAFRPMSSLQEYSGSFMFLNAQRLSHEVIYLPVQPSMSQAMVANHVQALLRLVPAHRLPRSQASRVGLGVCLPPIGKGLQGGVKARP